MDFLTCDKKTKPEPMPMPLPATSTTANERKALVDLHKSALFGESEPDMEDAMSVDTLEYEMESTICSSGLCELPTRNTSLTTVCSSFPLTARIESRHNWTLDTVESDSQQEQPRQPQEHSKGLSLPPNSAGICCRVWNP
ncbi:uncharacterized protein LOC115627623 isoform X2 [Scaptodrosophila lebanonensis]|uniref:Uncharacterized protein LOC115627623 isoform X2 n=1 Tax=Drosophila lebanonensis TaxID=7225 RepID=A0A6J2TWE8_DROLE|nr:uncharacterized protein LOC115627623 isoform X2 [Scaptodrosophila lebanonensis]